jgi:thiamine transporter
VFFGANAPVGQPVLVYSLLYNASYLVPTVVVTAALAAVVVPALVRSVPVGARPAVNGQG